jgi:hypothetical protein
MGGKIGGLPESRGGGIGGSNYGINNRLSGVGAQISGGTN